MLRIDLTGCRAVVTGGARGIGAGIVRTFVDAGARVAFSHLDIIDDVEAAEALTRQLGADRVRAFVAPSQDAQRTNRFVAEAAEWLSGINAVVCNAGYNSVFPLEEIPDEEWRLVYSINTEGTYYTVRAAIPYLKLNARSSIILIGSSTAYTGTSGAHYASSKAALEGLLRAMVKELTPQGIRCNMIHPSVVDTPMMRRRTPDPEEWAKIVRTVPVGRLGLPEDTAYLAAFLCSSLGEFIVGQSILVDGGRTFGR